MAELSPDIQTVYRRLDTLEKEIHQLRELLRPQISAYQTTQPGEHPYVESAPNVLNGEPCIKGTRTPPYGRLSSTGNSAARPKKLRANYRIFG